MHLYRTSIASVNACVEHVSAHRVNAGKCEVSFAKLHPMLMVSPTASINEHPAAHTLSTHSLDPTPSNTPTLSTGTYCPATTLIIS